VFEQDYVMRLIKEMVRAILKLLFNINTETPTVELCSCQLNKMTRQFKFAWNRKFQLYADSPF